MGAATYNKNKMNLIKTNKLIHAELKRSYDAGINIGFARAFAIMLWVLRQEGYGKKRCARFMGQVNDFCEKHMVPSIHKQKRGTYQGMKIEDICEALSEELGIRIDSDNGDIGISQETFRYYKEAKNHEVDDNIVIR